MIKERLDSFPSSKDLDSASAKLNSSCFGGKVSVYLAGHVFFASACMHSGRKAREREREREREGEREIFIGPVLTAYHIHFTGFVTVARASFIRDLGGVNYSRASYRSLCTR